MPLILILLLSLSGFLIATYFTAVAYGWMRPDARWIPSFCRMDERTCSSIVFTPQARVLGLPNSVLGQVYYGALIIAATGDILYESPVYHLSVLASLVSLLFAFYLGYSLLFVIRVPCRLCFASHAINLGILITLLVRA